MRFNYCEVHEATSLRFTGASTSHINSHNNSQPSLMVISIKSARFKFERRASFCLFW